MLLHLCVGIDREPQVGFYWSRGERTVPKGHRKRKVDPIRFQIEDKPWCQIRVPQQLSEVIVLVFHANLRFVFICKLLLARYYCGHQSECKS